MPETANPHNGAAGPRWAHLGRYGLVCALTALAALGTVLLFRPG